MKKWIFAVVLAGLAFWAIFNAVEIKNKRAAEAEARSTATGSQQVTGLKQGNLAPDFELETLDGKPVKLSDYRGKPVMLNFWATWCPECREELPAMKEFHEDSGMEILAVNLTKSEVTEENVRAVTKEEALAFPILMDRKLEVAKTYGVSAIPSTYILDKEGRIHYKKLGGLTHKEMQAQYNALK